MEDFVKYAYLNNYIKKFREKLPLDSLSPSTLHDALWHIGFKPDYGTMYSRNKLENILNSEYILNKLRAYLQIQPKSINITGYSEFNPVKKQEILPNYYSNEDMKNASDELLNNGEIYYENIMKKNAVKLNENTLKKIVAESVKKVLKEASTNQRVLEIWDEMTESVGPQAMLDMIYKALGHDQLVSLIKFFNRTYEFGFDVDDIDLM